MRHTVRADVSVNDVYKCFNYLTGVMNVRCTSFIPNASADEFVELKSWRAKVSNPNTMQILSLGQASTVSVGRSRATSRR